MSNADKPAFPSTLGGIVRDGMSERTLIAAMCLQGILSNRYLTEAVISGNEPTAAIKMFAKSAATHADALIEELQKQKQ